MSIDITPVQQANLDQTLAAIAEAEKLASKVATTEEILKINQASLDAGYNRTFDPEDLEDMLRPDRWHVIKPILLHYLAAGAVVPVHVRAQLFLWVRGKESPTELILDMSMDNYYSQLPADLFLSAHDVDSN